MKELDTERLSIIIDNILSNARKCSVKMTREDLISHLKILHKIYEIDIIFTGMKKNLEYDETIKAINAILEAEIEIVNGIYDGKTDKELINNILNKYCLELFSKEINLDLWHNLDIKKE